MGPPSSTAMAYRYEPLQFQDSIRVLHVENPSIPGKQMRGTLVQVRLRERPEYHALSYAWGDHTIAAHTILLGERSFQITSSLQAALSALSSGPNLVALWVDQISINQTDDIEKKCQVEMMASIFTQAETVIGWLGDSSRDSDIALKFFHLFSEPGGDGTGPKSDSRDVLEGMLQQRIGQTASDLLEPHSPTMRSVRSLLQRPWFSRRWVVQEIVLASNLRVRWGDNSITGPAFFAAVRACSSIITDPPLTAWQHPYWHAQKLGQLFDLRSSGRGGRRFVHLASELSLWECGRDQDRLNALWGLVDSADPATAWFEPTYVVSGPIMYRNFAEQHINATRNLGILHFAGCGYPDRIGVLKSEQAAYVRFEPPKDDIPTWTPDWRVFSRPLSLEFSGSLQTPFAATSSIASYSIDGDRLDVRASKVDTIKVCSVPYSPYLCNELGITAYKIFSDWLEFVETHMPSSDLESTFASTLVMDGKVKLIDHQDVQIPPDEIIFLYRHWLARNVHGRDDPDLGLDESARYGNVAEEVCRNRRFFVTDAGKLGLGPARISAGAAIYLIHGLKTPFVVESGLEADRLCGECFVHGMMYGEVSSCQGTTMLRLF